MKKFKTFTIIFMIICLSFCTFVCASDVSSEEPENSGNAGDYARSANGEEEPIATSDLENTPIDNNEDNDDDHLLNEDEIEEGDLYIFENDYTMDKMVDGNVFICGKNIKITGQVNGSVFVCASKVEIDSNAYIACHLFVAAEEVTINGMVLDVYSASSKLNLGSEALIYRQIKSTADSIRLAGNVGRDVSLFANNIDVADDGLTVYGDFYYEAKSQIENINDFVQGEVKFKELRENTESMGETVLNYVFSAIGTIIFDVLIYLALIFFAPKFVSKSKEYVSVKGVIGFAIGFAFIFAVPLISFLLCLTGVMSGIALLMLAIYFAVLMINALVVTTIANEFIADKIKLEDKFKKVLMIIPISLVLWGIRKIPYVGMLISAIVCLYGIGVVVLYQFNRRKE